MITGGILRNLRQCLNPYSTGNEVVAAKMWPRLRTLSF